MSHKAHDNSDKISRISINSTIITPNNSKSAPSTGAGILAVRAPSVEEHLSHAPTQLRTHARHEHETKPKPISRLGSADADFPPISDGL